MFLHLLEQINSQSEQFFNEFFSIYKPLSNDSKALFAVTFLMKNLHIHYMEKTFHYLKSRAPDRHKVLNLVEMLTILVTSKKENAVKLFNSKFEVEGEKASFSTILNLMLADPLESRLEADLELRDCAANIISLMTESVIADKVSHINLLNSYLLPEMADSIQKTPESELSWKYYYSFVKLIALCIDKENNTNSCNNFLVTNLINYKILQAMPAVYDRFQRHKPFQINFLQFTNTMMAIQEEEVIKVLLENSFLRIVWNCFKANYKKENIVFSICLKVFSDIERLKSQTYLDYFIDTFQDEISLPQFSCFPAIAKLMLRYRTLHSDPQATGPIDGQFSEGSSPGRSSGEGGKLDTAPTEGVKDFSIISSTNQEILRDMEEILVDEDKEKGASGTNMIEEQSNGAAQHAPEGAQGHLLGKREPLEG